MKKKIRLATCLSAALLCGSLGVANYYRAEGKPLFSLFSRASHEDTETWMTEEFFMKDALREGYAALMQDTGSSLISGVYIGSGRLVEQFTDYDPAVLEHNISAVQEFAKKHKLNLVLVPTASQTEKRYLPLFAAGINEKKLLDNIREQIPDAVFADLLSTMASSGGYCYRTDPHWNASGARVGYEVICRDILKHKASDFRFQTKSTAYRGPLLEKTGAAWIAADEIEEIIPAHPVQLTVKYSDGTVSHSLYNEDALETEDMYSYYLSAAEGKTEIETSVNTERSAVIICDDYALILVPYLAQEYSRLTIVRTGSYTGSLNTVLKDEGNTDIFMVMSLKNFCNEEIEFR